MKKYFFILVIFITSKVYSQAHFPVSNAIWNVHLECPNKGDELYGIAGDTLLNNIAYSKLYIMEDTTIDDSMNKTKLIGLIRNEGQKVLFKPKYGNAGEFILYDFSKSIGDTIWHNATLRLRDGGNTITFDSANYISVILDKFEENDLVKYNVRTGLYDNEYGFLYSFQSDWIQGIGSTKGLFWHLYEPPMSCVGYNSLMCFKYNDSIKYLNDTRCNKCFCSYLTSIIEKNNNTDWISIFPNPVQRTLTIKIDKPYSKIKVEIIDVKGSVVYKKEALEVPITFNDQIHEIYVIKLTVDNKMITRKIVIE